MYKIKPGYSLGSNIIYSLTMHWKAKKSTLVFCGVNILMGVSLPFTGILLPKLVIDELNAGVTPEHFAAVIGGVSAILLVLHYEKKDIIVSKAMGIATRMFGGR
jgi:ATP-binding cassette subfamily B protein